MPLYRAEAIVIRSWRYAEADLIVSFYSRDLGKIRGIAKGARKMTSRFGSSLQPFSHVMLQLFAKEGESLHRIRGVDVLHSFFSLAGEWERLETGARLLGLVDFVTPEAEQNDELFTLLLDALHLLAGTSDPDRVTTLVAIKLLAISGYEPELERCAQCGKQVNGRPISFLPSAGGVVCAGCTKEEALPLSRGTLQFLRRALTLSLEKGQRLRAGSRMRGEVRGVLLGAYGAAIGEDPRLPRLLDVSSAETKRGGVARQAGRASPGVPAKSGSRGRPPGVTRTAIGRRKALQERKR